MPGSEHRSAAIASQAIRMALTRRSFHASEVADHVDEPPSDRTVRRVLRQLETDGWLQRDTDGGHLWRPGPLTDGPILSV